jgi:epoxyqueuosine reductase
MELHKLLIECAKEEGFPLAGVIDIDLAFSDPADHFKRQLSQYDVWLQAGYAGSMEYLVRGRDRRANPRMVFPQAESILSVAIPYPRNPAGASSEGAGPKYARYLQGKDYHFEIADKLERVMTATKARWEFRNHENSSRPLERIELEWKICVDTSAVLERTWAALAGLGWIGKNTLLIHPQHGSYLFLAEVLINHKTGKGPALLANLCGNCTKCLTACPTRAIVKPGVLDSNQCVAYLTLEKRGELALEETTQSQIGTWVAGCDICQEVCPFNLKPTRRERESNLEASSPQLQNATLLNQWRDLLLETPEKYKDRVKTSAMKRVKVEQFSRNLAIALKNAFKNERPKEGCLSALIPLIQARFENEPDIIAQTKWKECLEQAHRPPT